MTAPKIIAGRWKGRPLRVPKGARPTSSRAREALFDVLQDSIPGARVLDVYAGSGAIGLEALSRGASKAVFVDSDPRSIEANLSALKATNDECELFRFDAKESVASLVRRGAEFDLVFVDPPYAAEEPMPARVSQLLASRGTLVVQTDSGAPPPAPRGLDLSDRRRYGRNVFWFYTRKTG